LDAAVKLMTQAFDDAVDARHQLAVERHRLQQQVVALAVVVLARSHEQAALYPWKEPKDRVPLAVRHIRTFLRANRP
jgi:hypothetical protein